MYWQKFFFTLALLFLSVFPSFAESPFVKGELLLQLTPGANRAQFNQALRNNSAELLEEIPQIQVQRIRVPEHAMDKVKKALSRNPNISFVEENFLAEGSAIPNDQQYPNQWHHVTIKSPEAWGYSTGSSNFPIAIIDSGVDSNHPDLIEKLIPGYNFLNGNSNTDDVLGHGTAVAGSAAASSNNGIGVAGVAWHNPIMPLVVVDSNNWATYSDAANAIIYAVDKGTKIINISLGGTGYSSALEYAVNYAWDRGALIFASAHNYSTDTPYYPAAYTNAVAVAATDSADNLASFSNYGDWITLSAPGVSILTTSKGGGYSYWNGTSFSSPLTAGLAALVWNVNPGLSNQQVLDILIATTDDLASSTFDFGRINAYDAVWTAMAFAPEADTEAPTVELTSPANNASVTGSITISANASDNVSVNLVEFYLNGNLLGADTTSPYNIAWDSSSVPAGSHLIEAVASDQAGNYSDFAGVTVTVLEKVSETDTVAPQVVIHSPFYGDSLENRTIVSSSASDENGIVEMRIYVDDQLQRSSNSDSIIWRWNTRKVKKGEHRLRVEASDPAGNIGYYELLLYK